MAFRHPDNSTMYLVKLDGGPYHGRFWQGTPHELIPSVTILNDRMLTGDMIRARFSECLLPPEPIVLEYRYTGEFSDDRKPIFRYVSPTNNAKAVETFPKPT